MRITSPPISFCVSPCRFGAKFALKQELGSLPCHFVPTWLYEYTKVATPNSCPQERQIYAGQIKPLRANSWPEEQRKIKKRKKKISQWAFYCPFEALVLSGSEPQLSLVLKIRAFPYASVHRCYESNITCYDCAFPNSAAGQVRDRVVAWRREHRATELWSQLLTGVKHNLMLTVLSRVYRWTDHWKGKKYCFVVCLEKKCCLFTNVSAINNVCI